VIQTSVTLFDRLKAANPDAADWDRFHDLYFPLIRRWVLRIPGLAGEVEDIAQDVFVVLVRELPSFERRREGSFRAWLRRITANRVKEQQRQRNPAGRIFSDQANAFLDQLADSNSPLARQIDAEHHKYVCETLLAVVRNDFDPTTWRAFQLFALEGRPAVEVARELAPMSVNAVAKVKARVLTRLREEAAGFLDYTSRGHE
jgi:RNA polymerase sigma-70 factor (ECF subfamily)